MPFYRVVRKSPVFLMLIVALVSPGVDHFCADVPVNARNKLYVTNSEGDDITVIDPATLKPTGSLKVGQSPHGIVASATGDRIYVTVEGTQKLLIINTADDRLVGEVPVGRIPNQPTLTRDQRFCYVPLRGDDAVDIVDLVAMKVTKRVPAPAWPHNMYTSADGKRIYLGSITGEALTLIDPREQKVTDEISMGSGVRPLAIPRRGPHIFVALSKLHGFAIFDLDQKKVIKRVELPALSADTPTPYLNTYTHGLLLLDDERELWVTSCAGSAVYVYSVADIEQRAHAEPLRKIEVGKFPHWFGVTKNNHTVFVSNTESNTVTAIDARSKSVLATIRVGKAPKRLLVVTPNRSLKKVKEAAATRIGAIQGIAP